MEVPIIFFLILFLAFIFLFLIFSVILVYHAYKFGVATMTNIITMVLYIAAAVILLFVAYEYINGVDWAQTIKLI